MQRDWDEFDFCVSGSSAAAASGISMNTDVRDGTQNTT
jgi:hypothetical protein